MKLQQMNNNPTYQQSMCASCATSLESNTTTTRKRDDNETITTANDTVRLVPELRFPEFQNAAEWRLEKLGNCLLQVPDYGVNAPAAPYSDKLPVYLRITDISEDGQFISDGKVSVDVIATVHNSLQVGDIVFARTGATVGKVYKYQKEDGPLVFAGFLIRVKPNASILNPDFLFQYLQTSEYKKWVEMTSTRSGQPGINSTEIESLVIPIPPTSAEQQKIAFFLQSIDNEIVTTKLKLDQLKTHKKALLQQLFPQRGKTVPELRFPEFQNTGEWQENMVGDAIKTLSPSKKLQSKEYKTIGKIPIIDQSQAYICGYSDDASAVLNRNSKELIIFGDHTCTLKLVNFPFIQGADGIKIFRSKTPKKLDTKFVYYMLLHIHIKPVAYKRHFMELKNKKLLFPPLLHEQKKIANVLQSIDDEIFATTNKLALLKSQKDALLQQLFPHI